MLMLSYEPKLFSCFHSPHLPTCQMLFTQEMEQGGGAPPIILLCEAQIQTLIKTV